MTAVSPSHLVPYEDVESLVLDPLRAVGLDDAVLGRCRLEVYTNWLSSAVHDDVRCEHLALDPSGPMRVSVSLLEAAQRACECCRPQVLWARAHLGGWSLLRLHQDATEVSRRISQLEMVPGYALSGSMRVELEEMLQLSSGRPGTAFRDAEARCAAQLAALARIDTAEELSLWGRRHQMVQHSDTPATGGGGLSAEQLAWGWQTYGTQQPARWVRRGPLVALAEQWDAELAAPSPTMSLVAITPGVRNPNSRPQRIAFDALWRWFGAGVRFKVVSDDALGLVGSLAETVAAGMVSVPCASPAAAEVATALYRQLRDVERCLHTAAVACAEVP